MIYGRFGDEIDIVSGDLATGAVRIRYRDNGSEDDAHVGFLRADGGLREIADAIDATETSRAVELCPRCGERPVQSNGQGSCDTCANG